jgi:hypothetical protein
MNRIILTLPQLWYSGGTKEEDSCSRGAGRILVVLMRCMSHFSCVLCLHHITNASRESLHKLDDGFNSCAPRCPRLCLSATFQPAPLSKDSKSSPTLPNWIYPPQFSGRRSHTKSTNSANGANPSLRPQPSPKKSLAPKFVYK